MPVNEIKRWTAVLILVGLVMSVGGSWAIAQQRARANEEDIGNTELDVALLEDYSHELRNDLSEINSSISVMENDIAWIKQALTEKE